MSKVNQALLWSLLCNTKSNMSLALATTSEKGTNQMVPSKCTVESQNEFHCCWPISSLLHFFQWKWWNRACL